MRLFLALGFTVGATSVHVFRYMHHLFRHAPVGDVLATSVNDEIRVVALADASGHLQVAVEGGLPAAHATGEEGVVALRDTDGVPLFEVGRDVQVCLYLKAALLKVAGEVSLAVYLIEGDGDGCLVVDADVWLHDGTAA